MRIDWLELFDEQFGNDVDIPYLRRNKFFGQLVINFQYGEPRNANTTKCHLSKNEQERRRTERMSRSTALYPEGHDDKHEYPLEGFRKE